MDALIYYISVKHLETAEGIKKHVRNVFRSLSIYMMWNKKPTRCHLVLYLFLLYKSLNMFRATLCPSSEADDLVVFLPRVV